MKAAILQEIHKIAIQEVEDLSPGPDELLIKTEFTGICGSDLHAYEGRHPFRKPPVVLGHEMAGTVVGVGENVSGIHAGARVTAMPIRLCGRCRYCRNGKPNLCENKTLPGLGGWQGTFAEMFLAPSDCTFALGDHTDFQKGALAEPLAIAIHSLGRTGVGSDSRVLVLGAGTIGTLTAVAAGLAGAESIVITDLYTYNLDLAAELSGAAPYNANEPDVVDRIARDHREKFDVVMICGGAPVLVHQALALAAKGGRIVVTGLFAEPVSMELPQITLNELEFVGTVLYTHEDFQKAVYWLNEGKAAFEKIISHIFPLDQAQSAMKLVAERREDFMKVLLTVER